MKVTNNAKHDSRTREINPRILLSRPTDDKYVRIFRTRKRFAEDSVYFTYTGASILNFRWWF